MKLDDVEMTARRDRLRKHIDERYGGNVSAYARAVNRQPQQITDMLAEPPRKSFGEKIARALAIAEGIDPDFFVVRDQSVAHIVRVEPTVWPFPTIEHGDVLKLPPKLLRAMAGELIQMAAEAGFNISKRDSA